jgi:Zn-dependent peptidase ImmA (M78 family)
VPGDRFRLTLGHELAHLLFHTKPGDAAEREGNRFAGALLFPREEFDAQMPERPQLRDFVSLKSAWGVSVAALVYRAHELGYVDDQRYRSLQIQMSKWRRSEPAGFEPATGKLMNHLLEVNGGVDIVSRDLGVNRKHLQALSSWSHLRVA